MRLGRGTYPVGVVDRGVHVTSNGITGPRIVDGRERARGRRRGERRERDGDAGESRHRRSAVSWMRRSGRGCSLARGKSEGGGRWCRCRCVKARVDTRCVESWREGRVGESSTAGSPGRSEVTASSSKKRLCIRFRFRFACQQFSTPRLFARIRFYKIARKEFSAEMLSNRALANPRHRKKKG